MKNENLGVVAVVCFVAACATASSLPRAHAQTTASVPFVGCKSDGQTDLLEAPTGAAKEIQAPAAFANRLAYYQAENGPGVLGPRGWTCFGVYGSNGETLYVTPDQLDSTTTLSSTWSGFAGPA